VDQHAVLWLVIDDELHTITAYQVNSAPTALAFSKPRTLRQSYNIVRGSRRAGSAVVSGYETNQTEKCETEK